MNQHYRFRLWQEMKERPKKLILEFYPVLIMLSEKICIAFAMWCWSIRNIFAPGSSVWGHVLGSSHLSSFGFLVYLLAWAAARVLVLPTLAEHFLSAPSTPEKESCLILWPLLMGSPKSHLSLTLGFWRQSLCSYSWIQLLITIFC